MIIAVRALTDGTTEAPLAVLSAPLSLWGGLDLQTGLVSDPTHPQCGSQIARRLLAMPSARGSSSSSSALVEAVRRGTAPAAIILLTADPILVIGSLVAAQLYQREVPIIVLAALDWPKLRSGVRARITSRNGEGGLELDHDALPVASA